MSSIIGKGGLQVGQWIQFTTEEKCSSDQEPIYQDKQRFLVISREDALFDACRCYVVDIEGKIYDYCARMYSLEGTDLVWNGRIQAVSKESVELIHGKDKVQAVYQTAKKELEKKADYFAKYSAKLLSNE